MHPVITIFCAFTRYWAVSRWLECLESMPHDPALTNIAIIIDLDDPRILRAVRAFVEPRGYRSFVFKMNEHWHPNEVRLKIRRARIADIKNQSKDLINQCDGDYVIGLEDDTIFPDLDIMRLLKPLIDNLSVGFVEGVQCGRWGVKMIGAWEVDDTRNPTKASTILKRPPYGDTMSYQNIDGGGFYGYATTKKLYLYHEYYSATTQPYGPDVNFGLWLRNYGYECLIDWDTVFGHSDFNKVLYPDDKLAVASFIKNITTGRWTREDHEGGSL